MASLCHAWFTTTNLSYRFPILKLPPPPCAVLLVCNLISTPLKRHTHTQIYIYIYVFTYIHTYIHKYIYIYVFTYIHTYIHKYIYIYLHTYIHTFIHTYIHTYISIYIYTYLSVRPSIHLSIHIHQQPISPFSPCCSASCDPNFVVTSKVRGLSRPKQLEN